MMNNGLPESSFNNPDYKDPIFDMFNATPPGGTACNWLTNPTLAPSSIAYYPFNNVLRIIHLIIKFRVGNEAF